MAERTREKMKVNVREFSTALTEKESKEWTLVRVHREILSNSIFWNQVDKRQRSEIKYSSLSLSRIKKSRTLFDSLSIEKRTERRTVDIGQRHDTRYSGGVENWVHQSLSRKKGHTKRKSNSLFLSLS